MKRISAFPAKTTPPRLFRVLPRPNLFARLEPDNETLATWLHGPPGAGKTTLIRSYLKATPELPFVWYRIDEGDNDCARFFHHLGAGVERSMDVHELSLPVSELGVLGDPRAFSRHFFSRLLAQVEPPFAVVLDNYEQLGEESELHQVVLELLETLPETVQLWIISRQPPPLVFSRVVASGNLRVPAPASLRLSLDEIRQLASKLDVARLGDELLELIAERTQGWAVGTTLFLRKLRDGSLDSIDELPDGSPELLLGYFANEVFGKQTQEHKDFLVCVALLPDFTPEAAKALTGMVEADRILSWLHQQNCFTECRHEEGRRFYSFHPLFREFLLTQLEEVLTKEERIALQSRAAVVAEDENQYRAAFELYLSAGNCESAGRVILNCAAALLAAGLSKTLEDWILSIPTAQRLPELAYWLGSARMFSDPPAARQDLEAACAYAREQGDVEVELLAWSGMVNATLIAWSDFRLLAAWLPRGGALLAEDLEHVPYDKRAAFMSAYSFALFCVRPDDLNLPAIMKQTARDALHLKDIGRQLTAINLLLHYYAWMGDLPAGRVLLDAMQSRLQQLTLTEAQQISWLAAQAGFAIACGDVDGAAKLAKQGIQLSADSGLFVWQHKLRTAACMASLGRGNTRAARCLANEALEAPALVEGVMAFQIQWLLAWIDWAEGKLPEALARLADAAGMLQQVGEPVFPYAKNCLAQATVLLALDRPIDAQGYLGEALQIARRVGSATLEYHGLLIQAQCAEAKGDADAGLEHLRAALRIGAAHGLLTTDWWDPAAIARLCALALEADIEPTSVRTLIAAVRLEPPSGSVGLGRWPWRIRIRSLGRFQVKRDGIPVLVGPHGQAKVLKLLKAIVAFGAKEVSIASLLEALWPDAEADDAYNNLKTSIHRLRKLLGHAEAVQVSNAHVSLNPRLCWLDTWELERHMRAANGRRRTSDLRAALKLFDGAYMAADDDEAWLFNPREAAHAKLRALGGELGHVLERQEEWRDAIEVYERVLEIDSMSELIYRRLMVCYERIGQRADALLTYERCRRSLQEGFGIAPSRETRAIVDDIKHH
ncbi:MAG: BTAD domain-containing putative transcriptional regulator [Gammaproteobacteria bacterium]